MIQKRIFCASVFISLIITMQAFAGQGLTCSDFRKYPASEQRRYLQGYVLGAAMELKYFKHNVLTSNVGKTLEESSNDLLQSVAHFGIRYLEEKYNLVNIAVAYPAEFYEAIQKECELGYTQGTGMFDVLPSTLEKMQKTGKYPVWGM